MRYISTRGGLAPLGFSDILLEGLAPDGGLAVPETFPVIDPATLAQWRSLNYPQLAFEIISRYATDIPAEDLRGLIEATYRSEVFGSEAITPLRNLEPGVHILGVSNGPTLAFKDIAMQFLGQVFQYVLERRGLQLNILGATSGDTGSAAEYAMRGKDNVNVFMLSPHGRMSPFQRAQMFSLDEPNIFNIAVEGMFDDCQDLVKKVSREDRDFKTRYRIGAVNSINWARIVAQVVYYFSGYFQATANEDQEVDFCVPSGNFGNIFAGYIAKRMGLPIGRLILATNENDVLDEFFRTGRYQVRPSSEVHVTSSPSMDISKASNFERYIWDVLDGDGAKVRELFEGIESNGRFALDSDTLRERIRASGFVSGSSRHADRMATIRQVYDAHRDIIDTHTADGVKVGREHRREGVPLICLETALPAKFEASIEEALGFKPPRPAGFDNLETLPQRFTVMTPDIDELKAFIAARAEGLPA